MTRALAAIAVAALVVLAGCGAVFGDSSGGGEPTSTVTPMAVPTDEPTPEPTPGPNTTITPGLTGAGIENATALVATHSARLRNTSFVTRTNTTRLAANGSVVFSQTSTLRAGSPGSSASFASELNGSSWPSSRVATPVRTAAWSNDGPLLLNQTYANGTSRYDRIDSPGLRASATGLGLQFALEPLGTANTSVTELERNGTTLYRVSGRVRDIERGNVSARLLVDSRGIIREYRTVRETAFDENVSRIVTERDFSAIGTTDAPERPSWVDEALNRTTPVSERTTAPVTATAPTTATTSTTTTGVPRLAPGLTNKGIANASALVAAHESFLRDRSFVKRSTITELTANDTVLVRERSTLEAGAGEQTYFVAVRSGPPGSDAEALPVRAAVWSNGERALLNRTLANGTTTYDRFAADGRNRLGVGGAGLRSVVEALATTNTTVTERDRNGSRLHLVRGNVSDGDRNLRVRLFVDGQGVVRAYRAVRETPFDGNASRIVRETRFSEIGVADAPERPSWVDEAMNRTTPTTTRPTVAPTATSATRRAGTTSNGTASVSAATTSSR